MPLKYIIRGRRKVSEDEMETGTNRIPGISGAVLTRKMALWAERNGISLKIHATDIIGAGGAPAGCEATIRSWDRHVRINTVENEMSTVVCGRERKTEACPRTVIELGVHLSKVFTSRQGLPG